MRSAMRAGRRRSTSAAGRCEAVALRGAKDGALPFAMIHVSVRPTFGSPAGLGGKALLVGAWVIRDIV
jgi:hypothetical protein